MINWKLKYLVMKLKYFNSKYKGGVNLNHAEDILSKYNKRVYRKYKSVYGNDIIKVFNPNMNNENEET